MSIPTNRAGSCEAKSTEVKAEADLGRYSEFGFPDAFTGKLVDVPLEQMLNFKFLPDVQVVFRGTWYVFDELEKDGTFLLRRGQP